MNDHSRITTLHVVGTISHSDACPLDAGAPKEAAAITTAVAVVIYAQDSIAIVILAVFDAQAAVLILAIAPDAICSVPQFVTGLFREAKKHHRIQTQVHSS